MPSPRVRCKMPHGSHVAGSCVFLAFAIGLHAASVARGRRDHLPLHRRARQHHLTRHAPCAKGQQRGTQHAAPEGRAEPATGPAPVALSLSARRRRHHRARPPQPMYECHMPTAAPRQRFAGRNPRWVPLWTLSCRSWPTATTARRARIVRHADGTVDLDVRGGGYVRGPVPTYAGYGGGTWVRDRCHTCCRRPETCARLRDRRRRSALTFFNNATDQTRAIEPRAARASTRASTTTAAGIDAQRLLRHLRICCSPPVRCRRAPR